MEAAEETATAIQVEAAEELATPNHCKRARPSSRGDSGTVEAIRVTVLAAEEIVGGHAGGGSRGDSGKPFRWRQQKEQQLAAIQLEATEQTTA